jgi:hypothetical protein
MIGVERGSDLKDMCVVATFADEAALLAAVDRTPRMQVTWLPGDEARCFIPCASLCTEGSNCGFVIALAGADGDVLPVKTLLVNLARARARSASVS